VGFVGQVDLDAPLVLGHIEMISPAFTGPLVALRASAVSRFLLMADLPSGAVTFLFTDIEGSTRLVKQLRERYGDVLHEHQRLLREAFKPHGGHEIDTQGDSFFIAFSSAREALLAAVEGQLALSAHPWPDDVRIRVRMGLHTGQAVASGGRYTGLAVHRAARIGAAGHGGQILVSQATQTLLEDEEEDLHIHLQDLGEQRLKDLDRPVRLYQAATDGLPAEFPPLRPGAEPPAVAPVEPFWRRPATIAAAAIGTALVVAMIAALLLRDAEPAVAVRANSVAVVDPDAGRVVDDIPVGTRPGPITFGAGSVWVGNLDDRAVTRLDARERTVLRSSITLEDRTPTGLAFGFGAVWVAHGRLGQVSRINPQFDNVSQPTQVVDAGLGGSSNGAVAVGAGSVWAVFGDSTLARIERDTGQVAEKTRAGALPAGIVVGSGSVWVSNSGEAEVWRYNPTAFQDPVDGSSVGRRPTGIAAGETAGEAIWVANSAADTVSRIDPQDGSVVSVPVGDNPTAISVTPDAVWVVNKDDGTLSRVDPETNEEERTVPIGQAPAGIVLAEGLLWVTVQAP
jgi:YVTN family beta-propeller protein